MPLCPRSPTNPKGLRIRTAPPRRSPVGGVHQGSGTVTGCARQCAVPASLEPASEAPQSEVYTRRAPSAHDKDTAPLIRNGCLLVRSGAHPAAERHHIHCSADRFLAWSIVTNRNPIGAPPALSLPP